MAIHAFVIPKEELKDFYLKFAFLLDPDSCSVNRTELDKIIATNKAIEKNIKPTSKGHLTNLFIKIASTIVTSTTAKKISIFIYLILSR